MKDFDATVFPQAMELDSLLTSHPIEVEVRETNRQDRPTGCVIDQKEQNETKINERAATYASSRSML